MKNKFKELLSTLKALFPNKNKVELLLSAVPEDIDFSDEKAVNEAIEEVIQSYEMESNS